MSDEHFAIDEQLDLFTGSEWEPSYDDSFNIVCAVDELRAYWDSYDMQHGWKDYPFDMWLEDAMYGVARAASLDYQFANGFEKFKKMLQRRWFKRTLSGDPL